MKALIQNNEVVDISESEFPVHESFTWMDCSDECKPGWLLENEVLTAPIIVEPTYAELRRREYILLNQFEMQFDDKANDTTTWDDAINEIKAKYPKPE